MWELAQVTILKKGEIEKGPRIRTTLNHNKGTCMIAIYRKQHVCIAGVLGSGTNVIPHPTTKGCMYADSSDEILDFGV